MSHGSMKYFDKNTPTKNVAHTRIDSISSIECKYVISEEVLGRGSFGVVHKATNIATNHNFAMKIIDKQTLGILGNKMLEREVAILKKVSHPYIVSLEEVFETSENTYLFMELCDKGELKSLIDARRLTEHECAKIIERLASAIAYLHDNDIVHRDLKLENILLSSEIPGDVYNIKVTDFGLSIIMGKSSSFGSENMMTTTCGTPMYMAPEILDNCVGYSHQCDIWSIGVITYMLLSRTPPFIADDEEELYEKIKSGKFKFESNEWSDISSAAKALIKSMIQVDPAARITAKEIRDHPWVRGDKEDKEVSQLTVIEMMKQFHRESKLDSDEDNFDNHKNDHLGNNLIQDTSIIEDSSDTTSRDSTPTHKKCPPRIKGGSSPRRVSLPSNGKLNTKTRVGKPEPRRNTSGDAKSASSRNTSPNQLKRPDKIIKTPKR